MNYFFAANFVLFLGSIYTIRTLAIQCSRDRPVLASTLRLRRHKRTEYRFFPDFFYTMGTIYSFLCGLLFLLNCIEIWHKWGLLTTPSAPMMGNFILDRQIYYYPLTAIGLTIAFCILPDRTTKLKDAQPAFVSFSLTWLSIVLLGIFLCR
jgi:hypothetical protein